LPCIGSAQAYAIADNTFESRAKCRPAEGDPGRCPGEHASKKHSGASTVDCADATRMSRQSQALRPPEAMAYGILECALAHFYVFEFETIQLAPDARSEPSMFLFAA